MAGKTDSQREADVLFSRATPLFSSQRAQLIAIARQRKQDGLLTAEQYRDVAAWLRHRKRTASDANQLCKRWGIPAVVSEFRQGDE